MISNRQGILLRLKKALADERVRAEATAFADECERCARTWPAGSKPRAAQLGMAREIRELLRRGLS